jgi:hypothetical protein
MSDDVLSNMRERVRRLRHLAEMINDQRAITVLHQMVEEGEVDIARLEAERASRCA